MRHTHTRPAGAFTLIELLVVIAIIALLVGILLPSLSNARESARRTACAAHFHDISTALVTYAKDYDETFPKYGTAGGSASARGFNPTASGASSVTLGNYSDNMTAALWILVRTGASDPKQFVCPSADGAKADDMKRGGSTILPERTWDFKNAKNLSYSSMNMYSGVGGNWGTDSPTGWVLLSDDNNATGSSIHTLTEGGNTTNQIQKLENSTNHDRQGQTYLFNDGSTRFEQKPFVGRGGDNAMAQNTGTDASPSASAPALTNSAVGTPNDAVMIPVTGNSGVNLTP